MSMYILMNVVDEHEMRVAVIRDGQLENLVHERIEEDGQHLGNIYKAKVANVVPGLDAAFIDLGSSKNGFIHIDDVRHDLGAKSRIEDVLKAGDELTVQVTKEAIRDKGPCLTTYLSIPGRNLVLVQNPETYGVSKKIEDHATRRRLKKLLASFEAPEGFGFIVRTAGEERSDEEMTLDHRYLTRLWQEIADKAGRVRAPACLYREADVVLRSLREMAEPEVDAIILDSERYYDEARAFAMVFMPELADSIQLHREDLPLMTYYGVEDRLAGIYDRQVQLPSGGNVVIEQTEALVSIDVNSAKSNEGADVGKTALQTNLEAVHVICEQLILRDLGGIIIIDFIDMESRESQRMLQLALRRALFKDQARTHIGSLSRFGLIEMTRQRTRPSHKIVAFAECPWCAGAGALKTPETFEIECMRAVRQHLAKQKLSRLEVFVPQDLAIPLLNNRHGEIAGLEKQYDCRISFVGDSLMKTRAYRLVGTPIKRGRRRKAEKPAHPGMLASLLDVRKKTQEDVKRVMGQGADALKKEVERLENGDPEEGGQTAQVAPAETTPTPARDRQERTPALHEEAVVLRSLLFTTPTPQRVGPGDKSGLARAAAGDKQRPAAGKGRSRRRRGSRR